MDPVTGAVIGAGMDIAGGFMNQRFALERQHQAQDFSQQMFSNRYQMTVADLKAAGLNPMLAYGAGGGSAPGGSASSAQGVNPAAAANEARITSAQEANIQAMTDKAKQETKTGAEQEKNIAADTLGKLGVPELIRAQVVQATATAEQSAAMRDKIRAEIPQVEAQIRNLESQISKNKSDVQLNESLRLMNMHKNGLIAAETFLTNAQTRNANLEADIKNPKAQAARSWSGEAAAQGENVSKIIKPVTDALGAATGARRD